MNVSNISFNAETPRNTSTGFRVKRPIRSALVAASHSLGEPNSPICKVYEFAEYEIARRAIKERSRLDDDAGRNALWALGQLEGITYAPGVVPNADGSFSFEWRTDRGFGSLKIGATYSSYQLYPQTSQPIEGGGAETSERCVGLLVNTLLYPSAAPSIHWAEPNAQASIWGHLGDWAQMSICGNLAGDCVTPSALPTGGTGELDSLLNQAFDSARFVEFENGKENEFTIEIIKLVKKHGATAVEKIGRALTGRSVPYETVAQTLLCLGGIDDLATGLARSRVVRHGLKSSSAIVRDAATIAIDSMSDKGAKAELRSAIGQETVPSLKQDMQAVLEYLEKTG